MALAFDADAHLLSSHVKRFPTVLWLCLLLALAGPLPASDVAYYAPSDIRPPAIQREFRGIWVAAVSNIDWPSKPGLPVAEQQKELRSILDLAVKCHLNAVILQMRPSCDALYESKLEPWSEYLTGQMGKPPEPYYDPLNFAIKEAHERGLELHAWFNPYRARHSSAKSPVAANHISRTKPQLVKNYGGNLWLDPAEPAVQAHALNVIHDVVKRYDIDGVHIDDYFYPYQVKDGKGRLMDFPDWQSWLRYKKSGGKLERNDWRRDNVNKFIEKLYHTIKAEKPWVKFGISPFGIWRPGYPKEIRGLDSYEQLYADARKWLEEGWCDYLSPQLYWGVSEPAQSYPLLLKWWTEQNKLGRHIWPGNNLDKIGVKWPISDFEKQIELTRQQDGATGNVFWHSKTLAANPGKLQELLADKLYAEPALIPASPWLKNTTSPKPQLLIQSTGSNGDLNINWSIEPGTEVENWALQLRRNGRWETHVFSGYMNRAKIKGQNGRNAEIIAISAMDRFGNLSDPRVFAASGIRP